MIVDQSSGICDQGNKPKHVILPKFNKSRKCLSFEKVRERKSTTFIIKHGNNGVCSKEEANRYFPSNSGHYQALEKH